MAKAKENRKPRLYRKAGHKGQKCVRGQPLFYPEKKRPYNTSLTPFAIERWNAYASREGVSVSELQERLMRGEASTLKLLATSEE